MDDEGQTRRWEEIGCGGIGGAKRKVVAKNGSWSEAKVKGYRGNLHVGTGVGVCIVVADFEDPVFSFFNRSGRVRCQTKIQPVRFEEDEEFYLIPRHRVSTWLVFDDLPYMYLQYRV